MNLSTFFNWGTVGEKETVQLPASFPLAIRQDDFIRTDIINIYSKILTDVVERVNGLSDEQESLLWDNCLMSESNDGVITRLAKAMLDKKDLFLVFDSGVVRLATSEEERQIREDYKKSASSSIGVFVSFKNFVISDMMRVYSALEFCTVAGLNKSSNLSNALQFKMNDLRGSVALADAANVETQALVIAKSLGEGRDVLLDAKDNIETAKPDLTSVKSSIEFVETKKSYYLGLPRAYITGEQTGGIGSTGENDTKAVERGLKKYFSSIIKPVLNALFKVKLTYKSQDFRQVTQALEAIKIFELTGNKYLGEKAKRRIVEGLLDISEDENDAEDEDDTAPAAPAIAPTPRGQA